MSMNFRHRHGLNNGEASLIGLHSTCCLQDCIFEDSNINADTEATVLAAFSHWAELSISVVPAADAAREQMKERIATICSRIRFPVIPASVLLNFYKGFEFMAWLDPEKELLMRAVRVQRAVSMPLCEKQHFRHCCWGGWHFL